MPRQNPAKQIILDTKKFRADVIAPKGKVGFEDSEELEKLRRNDNDDDFFHITCHIDASLHIKIQRGEFIDLEKLLSKDGRYNEDKRIELINKGGATYFVPVQDRDTKINSVHRWEQAFRIYATIYTKANPDRASEIWQYVHLINTAASSFHWDNVSFYDTTFRQLMAYKPWRSWAKTYVQGWNLAMRDLIVKNANPKTAYIGSKDSGARDWRDDCCWCFNKTRYNRSLCVISEPPADGKHKMN